MLSIQNLDIQFSGKHLFNNISVQVNQGMRIGLVGVNGAGKSTLLRIMAGEVETDPGVVSRAAWFTTAYLPQEVEQAASSRTLFAEAETAFADLIEADREMQEIGQRLAGLAEDDPELPALLERQGELQHRIEGRDIFRIQAQVEKVLLGLGFSRDDFQRPAASFSGGWLMRLMLARLLLQAPSLLLLDEPTNHLDLDSLTWLEEFLHNYPGSLLIVSHDRDFLDRVTTTTWELSRGGLTVYKGNYSRYIEEKKQRQAIEKAAWANQQAKIRQTERFIERFRSKATKARQVQSRIRQLERMERIELEQEERGAAFSFPPAAPSGQEILRVRNLGKRFGENQIFQGLDLDLRRGDKLAVVGVNGAGKTTFLKILAGLEQGEGEVRFGHNVQRAYFGQHQARELPLEQTVLESVYGLATDMTMTQVRSLLGAFLFRGDDVDKKVAVLSGGEKSRLALARMLVTPSNLMLLDEPTNHLDVTSQEVLRQAMASWDGTMVVVSHNRWFVNGFVNRVLEIRGGQAQVFEGNVDDFLERRRREQEEAAGARAPAASREQRHKTREGGQDRKALRRERARRRERLASRLKPWKRKSAEAEQTIERLEPRKAAMEEEMSDPRLYADQARWEEISRDYAALCRRLERAYHAWEEAQERIEAITAEDGGEE